LASSADKRLYAADSAEVTYVGDISGKDASGDGADTGAGVTVFVGGDVTCKRGSLAAGGTISGAPPVG
jgi:hypothetical protein